MNNDQAQPPHAQAVVPPHVQPAAHVPPVTVGVNVQVNVHLYNSANVPPAPQPPPQPQLAQPVPFVPTVPLLQATVAVVLENTTVHPTVIINQPHPFPHAQPAQPLVQD